MKIIFTYLRCDWKAYEGMNYKCFGLNWMFFPLCCTACQKKSQKKSSLLDFWNSVREEIIEIIKLR